MKQSLEQREAGRAGSESDAWLMAAEVLDRDAAACICGAVIHLRFEGRITDRREERMHLRVQQHLAGLTFAYSTRTDPDMSDADKRNARVLACLWLALECKDKSLLSGEDEASASLGMPK